MQYFSFRRADALVVRALQSLHGLSCSAAYEIFPDQGSNPSLLHWQADSLPLIHQGSPRLYFWHHLHILEVPRTTLRLAELAEELLYLWLQFITREVIGCVSVYVSRVWLFVTTWTVVKGLNVSKEGMHRQLQRVSDTKHSLRVWHSWCVAVCMGYC